MSERLFELPALDGDGLSRRQFLQAVGLGAAGAVGAAMLPAVDALAGGFGVEVTPIAPDAGVLVLVTLYGGNDGLNTIVPYTNGTYYDGRGELAIAPEACLPIDDVFAFNPALPTLHQMWTEGRVAAVHGVGYNPTNRSHFSSMANWMSGRFGPPNYSTGWIGRWLDTLPSDQAQLAVAEVGISLPLHLRCASGDRRPNAIPTAPVLIHPGLPSRLRTGLLAMNPGGSVTERGALGDAIAAATAATVQLADDVDVAYPPTQVSNGFVGAMTIAARLINANLGVRVLSVSLDGFDTHHGQPGVHPGLLAQLDAGLAALFHTLDPAWSSSVTVATLSEFGRTPHANASAGTDHGSSNTHFLIGANVRGGHHGEAPRLGVLDRNRLTIPNLDYRALYANLLADWLGADGSAIVGGSAEPLGLFSAAPGAPAPAPVPEAPTLSGFVPLSPVRVFDTRDGTGGRTGKVTAGEVWTVPVGGRLEVPGEARAVVLNLTATDPTEPTFVTAWNAGAEWPGSSNLNPLPGRAVPNLTIGRIGHRGELAFTAGHGAVDLIADLVGYFDPIAVDGMQPLAPARLLDTRTTATPLGEEQSIELQVTGVGGVPTDAVAVALNLTSTNATQPSFLTMWPTGEEMPLASSLNLTPGLSIPNLVVAPVGAGGMVSIFNRFGTTDVLVDVLGCFRPGGSRFIGVTPVRLLDTREGLGAPLAEVGGDLRLQVAGMGGVPNGATAALLNVTAVRPSQPTFVTVYASGSVRPLASNLNAYPGDVIPNMVVAGLGPDGATMLYNAHGTTHLLADLVGYFS
jgi:uncharacterized protein (DUF1501 family)